ncbi:MAG: MMPL family transporter [Gammaproteobacteria bacterium]|jgi:predicted exporter|nr:MMPL family transporter [Gammaproteobacteria bacterium]MDH3819491.1 MMPL family transporter [Gammaproteobacteria bacterium]
MIFVIYLRLELSFDLSAFVPTQTTVSHEILIEQIKRGPASRLLVIGIAGASSDRLADVSDQLKRELSESPTFVVIMNGEVDAETSTVPAPVDRYYLLMRDVDYSIESLRSAMQSRLKDLAFGGGATLLEMIARDPFLVTLDILEQLPPAEIVGDMWFADDGSAVLMAETVSTSIDTQAQRAAIDLVKTAFHELPDTDKLTLDITGVGAFSVELQETIRKEATIRSVLASLALMLVILVVFRKPRHILLAALPLGMGFLAGLALVSMLFERVHGITLAFGFTMLGVVIDYPLHLFSHAQSVSGRTAIRRIWPTLRLGVTSTAIAYLALLFSGSQGLAQLGSFTVTGVIFAMLVTRTWLPHFVSGVQEAPSTTSGRVESPTLGWTVGLLALLSSVAVTWHYTTSGLWDDQLSSLSPVSAERLSADRRLRGATATPDMRYQLFLQSDSLDALLEDCEQAEALLMTARDDGLVMDWQSVCQLLPSWANQESRRQAIPETEVLRERVRQAAADTPFRAEAFEPFINAAAKSRQFGPLGPDEMRDTPLRSWLDAHLMRLDSQWIALVSLIEPKPDMLESRVTEWPISAGLIDLQNASLELMRDYRISAVKVITIAALLILALLWLVRGEFKQMLWVGLTVTAALGTTMTVTSLIHGGLTVMHLVAMLLVLGLGLDYALFLSRSESVMARAETRKGVLACAASTTLAFSILAGSSIPILKYLGLTVATGSTASYLLAYFGSRTWGQRVS